MFSYLKQRTLLPTLPVVNEPNYSLQSLEGVTITDSTNVLFEGDYDGGDLYGSIDAPNGGDQSANLVVSGTTSGVILRDIIIGSGAGTFHVWTTSWPPVAKHGHELGQTPRQSRGVLVQKLLT